MKILIAGAQLWDAERGARVAGEVLLTGARIEAVATGRDTLRRADAQVVDATGCTLMPGLVDVHSHLSFPAAFYPNQIEDTPPEETLIAAIHNARLLLDCG